MQAAARDALLTLTLTPGLGPTLTRRAVEMMGSPEAVLTASAGQLNGVKGIGDGAALRAAIAHTIQSDALAAEKQRMQAAGARVLAMDEQGYPPLLRHIPDPPPVLYVQGELTDDDAVALAVVGSRHCSLYGREQADRLAGLCAESGLCIISGGARGIDAAAHRAALRCGGRTVAVLGSGLGRPYPAEHEELFATIAAGRGAVVSELPMDCPPLAEHFPRRNRIISGLALGVLVIEAALRSGALITARLAAEEQGREVMALPGRVDSLTSAGCHKIIREGGAALVTSASDILDCLGESGAALKAAAKTDLQELPISDVRQRNISDSQRKLLDALIQPRSFDELAAATGLTAAAIQADLTMLQIRGLIARGGGKFEKKSG